MFEARIAELNRFNEQNPVSYDKRTYTVDEIRFKGFPLLTLVAVLIGVCIRTRCPAYKNRHDARLSRNGSF